MKEKNAAVITFDAAVPQFTVPDVGKTAEFYRTVLGFDVAGFWDGERVSSDANTPPVFAIIRRGNVQEFFSRAERPAGPTNRAEGAYDVYFRVRGVDLLAAESRSRGADVLDGPEDRTYGQRELVVRDCNGLILAFGEDVIS